MRRKTSEFSFGVIENLGLSKSFFGLSSLIADCERQVQQALQKLDKNQKEIMTLLLEGKSALQITRMLVISKNEFTAAQLRFQEEFIKVRIHEPLLMLSKVRGFKVRPKEEELLVDEMLSKENMGSVLSTIKSASRTTKNSSPTIKREEDKRDIRKLISRAFGIVLEPGIVLEENIDYQLLMKCLDTLEPQERRFLELRCGLTDGVVRTSAKAAEAAGVIEEKINNYNIKLVAKTRRRLLKLKNGEVPQIRRRPGTVPHKLTRAEKKQEEIRISLENPNYGYVKLAERVLKKVATDDEIKIVKQKISKLPQKEKRFLEIVFGLNGTSLDDVENAVKEVGYAEKSGHSNLNRIINKLRQEREIGVRKPRKDKGTHKNLIVYKIDPKNFEPEQGQVITLASELAAAPSSKELIPSQQLTSVQKVEESSIEVKTPVLEQVSLPESQPSELESEPELEPVGPEPLMIESLGKILRNKSGNIDYDSELLWKIISYLKPNSQTLLECRLGIDREKPMTRKETSQYMRLRLSTVTKLEEELVRFLTNRYTYEISLPPQIKLLQQLGVKTSAIDIESVDKSKKCIRLKQCLRGVEPSRFRRILEVHFGFKKRTESDKYTRRDLFYALNLLKGEWDLRAEVLAQIREEIR